MVNKLLNILNTIKQTKGPFTLFAVTKMDDVADRWSLIISALWLDRDPDNINRNFNYIVNLIRENLTEDEMRSIARIGIFHTDNHMVQMLLDYADKSVPKNTLNISIDNHPLRLSNQQINGNKIYEGYILQADISQILA